MGSRASRAEWLDLHKVRVFAAVAEQQHYSKAAATLHISQPALSVHVRDLERYFGLPLFERVGRGVRLTDAGHMVHGYAKRLLALTLELEEAVDDVKGVSAGRLSIGASTTPGAYLLPALLSSFRQRYPAVAVAVEIANTAAIAELIREGELHLGLLGEPLTDPDLELEPYLEDELLLVVPPTHRWADRQIGVKNLNEEPLIVREEGSATDDVTRQALAKAGLDIGPGLVLGNTEAVKGAVAGGLGVAFVSACAVVHEISSGRLARCRVRGFAIKRRFQIARRRGRRLSAAEQAFLALARAIVLESGSSN
jgi:DNA-binding transcriptional LysR family regulator